MTQKAILWDMDGVLIDSEPLHREKVIAVASEYGVAIKEAHYVESQNFAISDGKGGMKDATMPLHGAGEKNIYYWMLAQNPQLAASFKPLPRKERDARVQEWLSKLFDYYIAHKDRLKPHAATRELVKKFAAEGIIQGVVSSGISRQVEVNLATLKDAADEMAFALTADDVKFSKPDPQGYSVGIKKVFEILKERGAANQEVAFVAVEDSPSGVKAALGAGIACVQFLQEGQPPTTVEEKDSDKFRVARNGEELEKYIRALLATAKRVQQI